MKNVTITINATISVKVNDDAKVKHHDKSRNNHTTNKTGSGMFPKKVLHINEYEAHHPSPEDERFFVYGECDAIAAKELIVRDGKIFAIDESTLKGIEGNSVGTSYGGIRYDGNGGLKLFSDRYARWFKCSVANGVYSIKNLISDARKYNL